LWVELVQEIAFVKAQQNAGSYVLCGSFFDARLPHHVHDKPVVDAMQILISLWSGGIVHPTIDRGHEIPQ
jgi:hypothetical protein